MLDGLKSWFCNFAQFSRALVTPEVLTDIPQPYAEFAIFSCIKGGEISSILGGLIIHPVYRYYLVRKLTPENTTNNSRKIIRNICRRIQGRCLLGGLAIGPIAGFIYIKCCNINEAELKEKCYRIRCHEQNMVWDRSSVAFGFLGWYWRRFQGAVNGISLALVYTILYFTIFKKYTSPLLRDKIDTSERLGSIAEAKSLKDSKTPFKNYLKSEFSPGSM